MDAAEGVIKSKDANLLNSGGSGGIKITKWWARSLFNRMGMVKRKACSKNKIIFKILGSSFYWILNRSLTYVEEILHALIINWDQTAICTLCPSIILDYGG